MKYDAIKSLLSTDKIGSTVTICGWVRTFRNDTFLAVNDGSTIKNIQLVIDREEVSEEIRKKLTTGASICATGELIESKGSGQATEVKVATLELLGEANPDEFPIQMKRHSLDFLREKAHLRFRTSTFSAVFRIRHGMTFAIHKYFNDNGFYNLHTPIITGSDAEGAGEMFRVTTLDIDNPPRTEDGKVDEKEDFFGKISNLTVSGQLEAELGAMALGKVYTFGPTFRAENSNTSRHLAEFWMIEPEVAFNDLVDNMDLAEDFLRYLVKYALDNFADDLAFLDEREAKENQSKPANERPELGLLDKLKFVADNDFERITYTEAIRVLLNSKPYKKKKFKFPIEWGIDLQSEHERFLTEKHVKKPINLIDYPAEIKAYYMKQNADGKTVSAMDVLFPRLGEIVGGSQREDSLETLSRKMKEHGLPGETYDWYLDLRRFGSVPHSGFGLGFERLVQFVSGMKNIRDVIPFPRVPGNANF